MNMQDNSFKADWSHLTTHQGLLNEALLSPLNEFYNRPSKKFRATLVQIGAELLSFDEKHFSDLIILSEILEHLHNGSLIIDDIQDHEKNRRGSPALHHLIGPELAINSGNWLYFYGLNLINKLSISNELKYKFSNHCSETLLKAHIGQAYDLKADLSKTLKKDVKALVEETFFLKTGELTALAFSSGCYLHDDRLKYFKNFYEFGKNFGVSLQILDDLEDLISNDHQWISNRPHWIWTMAETYLENKNFEDFKQAVVRQDKIKITQLLNPFFELEKQKIFSSIDQLLILFFSQLNTNINIESKNKLINLASKLKESYV
jgi:hypothetical protein